jgi:hypothetical protein
MQKLEFLARTRATQPPNTDREQGLVRRNLELKTELAKAKHLIARLERRVRELKQAE